MEIKIIPFTGNLSAMDRYKCWFLDIDPKSKKIKKTLKSPQSQTTSPDEQSYLKKKYNIVDSKVKSHVVLDVKKGILLLIDLDKEKKPLSSKRFFELIDEISLKEYNNLLTRVLIKHVQRGFSTTNFFRLAKRSWKPRTWTSGVEKSKAGSRKRQNLKSVKPLMQP